MLAAVVAVAAEPHAAAVGAADAGIRSPQGAASAAAASPSASAATHYRGAVRGVRRGVSAAPLPRPSTAKRAAADAPAHTSRSALQRRPPAAAAIAYAVVASRSAAVKIVERASSVAATATNAEEKVSGGGLWRDHWASAADAAAQEWRGRGGG